MGFPRRVTNAVPSTIRPIQHSLVLQRGFEPRSTALQRQTSPSKFLKRLFGAAGWDRTNIIGFSIRYMNHHCYSCIEFISREPARSLPTITYAGQS